MSKSLPRDLCWAIKMAWEEHPKNRGRDCSMTGRDLKEAKEWLAVNGEIPEFEVIKDRTYRYLGDNFEPWVAQDWPIWGLLRHWGRYSPPRAAIQKSVKDLQIHCSTCGKSHGIMESCRVEDIDVRD